MSDNKAVQCFKDADNGGKNDLTKYESWYSTEAIKYLVHSRPKLQSCVRYIFSSENFLIEFNQLRRFRNLINLPIFFISFEPGEFLTSHFIFGILIAQELIIINPKGKTKHKDFYETLLKVKKSNQYTEGIKNIYISDIVIQLDSDKKGVNSCGPICIELINHISNMKILDIFKVMHASKREKEAINNENVLEYNLIDIQSILPNSLTTCLDLQISNDYKSHIVKLRSSHLESLQQLNTHLSMEEQDNFWGSCLKSDEQELMELFLFKEKTIEEIKKSEKFKRLLEAPNSSYSNKKQTNSSQQHTEYTNKKPTLGTAGLATSKECLEILIPADGDCLYSTVFVGYLLPVINDKEKFFQRLIKLTGDDIDSKILQKKIIDGSRNVEIYKKPHFKSYIQKFRKNLGLDNGLWGGPKEIKIITNRLNIIIEEETDTPSIPSNTTKPSQAENETEIIYILQATANIKEALQQDDDESTTLARIASLKSAQHNQHYRLRIKQPSPKENVNMNTKQPTVWKLNFDIPHLFSLCHLFIPSNEVIRQLFEDSICLVEKEEMSFQETNTFMENLKKLKMTIDIIAIDTLVNQEEIYILRIRFTLLYCFALEKTNQLDKLKYQIDYLLENLAERKIKSDETWWYYGSQAFRLSCLVEVNQEAIFNILISSIENISSKKHKKALFFLCLQFLSNIQSYPQYNFYERLDNSADYPWKLDGFCAARRHEYIEKLLKNKSYFNLMKCDKIFEIIATKQLKKINFEIVKNASIIGETLIITREFSYRNILEFAAHIAPPSLPIPYVNIPNIPQYELKQVNQTLISEFRSIGYCNSEGFLKKNIFNIDFCDTTINIIAKVLKAKLSQYFKDIEQAKTHVIKNINIEVLKKEYERLCRIKDELAGFNGIKSLILFYYSLGESEYSINNNLLHQIKLCISNTLEISYIARNIQELDLSFPKKHERWFNLAVNIVNYLNITKRTILLQTGTPIKADSDEGYSLHAFYIAFKYLANFDQYQIIITNGGNGVSRFHKLTSQQVEKDRKEYRYVAFKPLQLTNENKEKLKHYIYSAITICYEKASISNSIHTDQNGNKMHEDMHTFYSLLEDIYMDKKFDGGATGFIGYQFKEIIGFEREDINESFLEQLTGNCTIHNLKKALQITFNMNNLTFGLLEDTICLGFDRFITEREFCIEPEPTNEESSASTKTETKLTSKRIDRNPDLYNQSNLNYSPQFYKKNSFYSDFDLADEKLIGNLYPLLDLLAETFEKLGIKCSYVPITQYIKCISKKQWLVLSSKKEPATHTALLSLANISEEFIKIFDEWDRIFKCDLINLDTKICLKLSFSINIKLDHKQFRHFINEFRSAIKSLCKKIAKNIINDEPNLYSSKPTKK